GRPKIQGATTPLRGQSSARFCGNRDRETTIALRANDGASGRAVPCRFGHIHYSAADDSRGMADHFLQCGAAGLVGRYGFPWLNIAASWRLPIQLRTSDTASG